MISITLDLEWATSPVLRDTFDLLANFGVEATLFSTHDDPFDLDHHERALHPNFTGGEDPEEIVAQLSELYPDAIGLRSHQMHVSTKLRDTYAEQGVEYESNYMTYRVGDLAPFSMPGGTVQFPVYWMDDVWFRGDGDDVDISELLDKEGLKVFDFHPPHVAFNTPTQEFYQCHKEEYWTDHVDIDDLQYEGYGVRTILLDLLQYITSNGLETRTMGELYKMYQTGQLEKQLQ